MDKYGDQSRTVAVGKRHLSASAMTQSNRSSGGTASSGRLVYEQYIGGKYGRNWSRPEVMSWNMLQVLRKITENIS